MARKPMAKKRGTHKTPLPGWVWLSTGLMVGLFVAFLVYLRDVLPTTPTTSGKQATMQTDARSVRVDKADELPPPPKTRFDFYTILPEMEVAVPEEDLPITSNNKAKTVASPGSYILQAGAFRQLEQADRMKAELALLGIEANIQSVTIDNQSTWHRVRIGPYSNLEQLNKTRQRLRDNNINAMLLRLKS
ncbi:MAG: SPOR domain-containing protein [Granulosicoccaceae bacterium]|jgi:cell division protein FtsN